MKKNKKKPIIVKWDDEKVKLTPGYVRAVKQLMREEILMIRKHRNGKEKEAWYCGVAEIKDLAKTGSVEMMYGGKDDIKWLKTHGQIFVTVPF